MPETSRRDAPPRDPQYPQGAEGDDFSGRQLDIQPPPPAERTLPAGDIYGEQLRSRAESFGRSLGSAVGSARRVPQRLNQATSRIRHAGSNTRAQASAVVLDMMDTAAQRADRIRRNTSDILSDWARNARFRSARLEDQAAERWEELRSAAGYRMDVASRRAVEQWNRTQRAVTRVQQEDPAKFLAIVAGTAFVIGAGLRIWRSSND